MEDSLNQKFSFLDSKLALWSNVLEPVRTVTNEKRLGYRTKAVLHSAYQDSHWVFGMKVNDKIIPIPDCPVHSEIINQTLNILGNAIPKSDSFPLAFVVQANAQVVLIVKSNKRTDNSWLSNNAISQLNAIGVEGLWVHYNPSAGRRLFEKTPLDLLFGKPKSIDVDGFYYGPGAFQQLIPELYNQTLDETITFLQPNEKSAVIDLYCGIGKSIQRWVEQGSNTIGVEQNGAAIESAKINVPEATILRGACRQRIPQLSEWTGKMKKDEKRIFLYLNPPRTGVEKEVMDWVKQEKHPEKIAYLSCSPGTLSKDLTMLTKNGYRVSRLIPFDFFPQTIHVECLALLEKI